MTVFKNYNAITRSRSYNNHYNPHGGMETSTSLYYSIQKRDLTSCPERLEKLGYSQEQLVVVLGAVQLIAGLEVVA